MKITMIHMVITPGGNSIPFYGMLAFLIVILAILFVFILKISIKKREVTRKPIRKSLQDVMILSLEKRTETAYHISLESVTKVINPVKLTQTVEISPEMRSDMIARIDWTSKFINTFLCFQKTPKKAAEELKKMGTVIYKNFIPRDIAKKVCPSLPDFRGRRCRNSVGTHVC